MAPPLTNQGRGLRVLQKEMNDATEPVDPARDRGALGRVRRARIAAEAADWPQTMEETVKKTVEQLRALEDALRDEDVQRAAGPAHEVHELAHQVSDMAYAVLNGTTPRPETHY